MLRPTLFSLFAFALFFAGSGLNKGYNVGDEARDFKLKNVDGKMISMADYKDAKGFILIFTCNHCPYSVLYEDRIIDLQKKYGKKGYPVIAINPNDTEKQPDDSFDNMKIRAKDKGFNFPYVIDETQEIARAYGASRTPHVYIVNKESGKLKVAYIGAIDDNSKDGSQAKTKYVEDAVNALRAGKKIQKTESKAVGCTIKWKDA